MNAAANTNVPRIQDQALLVEVSIRMWGGTKTDKAISSEVALSKHAEDGLVRVRKTLMDSDPLKEMKRLAGQVRNQTVAKMTLPWKEGQRLVTTDILDEFENEMNAQIREFERLKAQFAADYQFAIHRAQLCLGQAFDEDDYPEVDDVLEKCEITYSLSVIPDSSNISVPMSKERIEKLRASIESDITDRVGAAAENLHERVVDVVGHLVERLDGYSEGADGKKQSVFRDSTLENVERLVEVLPALNITKDPKLDAAANDLRQKLKGLDGDKIRKDPDHRKQVTRDAKSILDNLGGFMG